MGNNTTMSDTKYPIHPYQNLFEHMANEHGLILLESEMDEIIRIAKECEKKTVWRGHFTMEVTTQKP
jgi:hypothetical protein